MKIGIVPRLASVTAAAVLIGVGIGTSGCTTAVPAVSECAATTNGGFGSGSQGISSVVHPGGQVQVGSGDTAWYWPCNARNFVTGPGGDRLQGLAVRTAGRGSTPGMPVYLQTRVYFTPNQNENVMKEFLPFCLKYGCATTDPQSDASIASSAHSSSTGWENMLLENMGPAIDFASQAAVQNFDPDLWLEQENWPKLADEIRDGINAQIAKESEISAPIFCGSGSSQSNCTKMTVLVTNVIPADPAVVTNYNKQVAAEQATAANAARVAAAKQLYGPYAQYFLGIQDTAQDCPKCTLYVGAPNAVPTGK